MSTYTTPPFDTLRSLTGTECRWVGSTIMDEEQYRVERWEQSPHEFKDASDVEQPCASWRASISGMNAYAEIRKRRRADRKSQWQARQEDDPAHQSWINEMVESAP